MIILRWLYWYFIAMNTVYPCHILCLSQGFRFPTSYVMIVFVFSGLRWEVIVLFVVDIGEIVDHHCLYFLFITIYIYMHRPEADLEGGVRGVRPP